MKQLSLALGLSFLTLSSFECYKSSDQLRASEESNTTIDFTNFPAHTIFTITGESGQGYWVFDSDSSKLFTDFVPEVGRYSFSWKIIDVPKEVNYRALMMNSSAQWVSNWETNTITGNNYIIKGIYTFTKTHK